MIVRRAVFVACLALPWTGCHQPVCPEPGYDAGERFQVTVVDRTDGPDCGVASLKPGDTLTMVAGELLTMSDGCSVRAAEPAVPAFARDLVSMCAASPWPLGLSCNGAPSPTTVCFAQMAVHASIQRGAQSADGRFTVAWSGVCNPHGCIDTYDVHVERLSPG
jgi:hypothetical protein